MNFLFVLFPQIPYLSVIVVMGIVALAKLSEHRTVSTLVLVFAVIETVLVLFGAWLSVELIPLLTSRGYQVSDAAKVFGVFAFASNLLRALALALLALAVFGWRRQAIAPGYHPHPYPSSPPATPPKPTT